MSELFKNQTAIISGGLGDIGFAVAREFAKEGADIAIGDILPPAHARESVKEIEKMSVKCLYHQVDVSDAEAVQHWVLEVESELSAPRIIIANAATATLVGIHEVTPEQWTKELRINLDGAFYLTQCTTRRLRALEQPGRVVFVGSWAAHAVHQHLPAYSVSKAGLRMLCQCMALELAPFDILVNEIAPGYVNAGLSGKIWEKNPEMARQAKEKVPIKRVISAEEVAQQVVHLCHPQNRHMTGSTLLMDGGLSLPT